VAKDISSVLIYTSGDFPYGMAPENLVRQLALGLDYNNVKVKVVRFRGRTYNYKNDTGIECTSLLFDKRLNGEISKVLELFCLFFAIPISVVRNYFKSKPNVIVLYGIEYFYFILPFWIISKLLRVKILRFITDYYKVSTIVPVWWKKPKLLFYHLQFKYLDKRLDGIITLSQYMAEYSRNKGVSKNRIITLPHFIDVIGFCKDIQINRVDNKVRIGYCGTISESNGIFDLIRAFVAVNRKFNNTELIIIGEPSTSDRQKIEEMLGECSNSYRITGLMSKDQIPTALLTCSILVNPRKSGIFAEAGFPTKLGEYFSTKIPVISTRVGDIKSFFTNKNELLLVDPDSPEQLSQAILYLIENELEAQIVGSNGYSWATQNLDFRANSKKLIEFIGNL